MSQNMFKSFRPFNWSSSNKILTLHVSSHTVKGQCNEREVACCFKLAYKVSECPSSLFHQQRLCLGHVLEHFLLCRQGIRQRFEGRNFQPPCVRRARVAMKLSPRATSLCHPAGCWALALGSIRGELGTMFINRGIAFVKGMDYLDLLDMFSRGFAFFCNFSLSQSFEWHFVHPPTRHHPRFWIRFTRYLSRYPLESARHDAASCFHIW